MNESPETDDDRSIRRLLEDSGTGESPELLEGLRLLRSFRALPAPAPTGDLAAMLTEPPAQSRRRSQRHRGLILSFTLAGAMAAGTTGVAANNDLRLATESFCADVIEQVLPQDDSGEPGPPADVPAAEPLSAPVPSPEGEVPAMADAAAEPDAGFAAASDDPAAHPASPTGEASGEDEVSAGVEDPPPVEAPLPAPHTEPEPGTPEPGTPDHGAQERGKSGSHTITARPREANAGEDSGHPGRSATGPAGAGPAGEPGSGPGNSGSHNSGSQNSGHAPSGRNDVRSDVRNDDRNDVWLGDEQQPVPEAEAPGGEPAPGKGGM